MPILQNGVPELYDKLWKAFEQPLRDTILCKMNGCDGKGNILCGLLL